MLSSAALHYPGDVLTFTMQAKNPSKLPACDYRISLCIRHPSIDPAEISRELGIEADESFAAGAPRQSRSGIGALSVYGESYWAATLDSEFYTRRIAMQHALQRVAAAGGEGSSIPERDRSVLSALMALGMQQGCLTDAQVREQLSRESVDPQQVEHLIKTLTDMGMVESKRVPIAAVRARSAVRRAQWRQMGQAVDAPDGAGTAVFLTCGHLLLRHGAFMRRMRSEGGSLTLVATLSSQSLSSFRITPELGHWLNELGMTVELDFAST
jgi:hypothetical protein